MTKSKGGRGLRSENKYERFTATLSPDLLELLDGYAAARGLSRSEMLAKIIARYSKMWPLKAK